MVKQPPEQKTEKPAQPEASENIPQNPSNIGGTTGASPQTTGASLQNEIRMLRTAMQNAFELGQAEQDPEFTLKVLRTLSSAAGKLAGLLKSQQQIAGAEENEATAAISKALHDLMNEWGLK